MAQSIVMPALAAGMEEATIARWHKAVGDAVTPGEVIAEIETDKATMELTAEQAGKIGKIVAAEGTTVAINAPIALLLADGEEIDEAGHQPPVPSSALVEAATTSAQPPPAPPQQRPVASPLARRIAAERSVALDTLTGSGPHGRIVRLDVENAAAELPENAVVAPAARDPTSAPANRVRPRDTPYTEIPLTKMRKVIARRLADAKATVPHFYLDVDCDLDALLELRNTLNSQTQERYKFSVNDFIIKAAALALRQVPEANTAWTDDAILQFQDVDIAVAVATDGGLITPIVREADRQGLISLSAQAKALAARAREGRLKPEEYQGGSFTLSNLGMFGVRSFSAIINPPQSCILAVGVAERRPVVRGEVCVAASVMSCTLSVDHRAVDGAVAARYLTAFKSLLEQPLRLLL